MNLSPQEVGVVYAALREQARQLAHTPVAGDDPEELLRRARQVAALDRLRARFGQVRRTDAVHVEVSGGEGEPS